MKKQFVVGYWLLSLLAVGTLCWIIAPSEKIVYREEPTASRCKAEVGDRGFIDYGEYRSQVGKVVTIENCYDMVIELDSGAYITAPEDNFNIIEKASEE